MLWYIIFGVSLALAIAFQLWRATLIWKPGRKGTGYLKKKLFKFKYLDSYLVKYPNGSYVAPHTDPVDYGQAYRLNVMIHEAKAGGLFEVEGGPMWSWNRFTLFRPDIQEHSVSEVTGLRVIFSIGVVIPHSNATDST